MSEDRPSRNTTPTPPRRRRLTEQPSRALRSLQIAVALLAIGTATGIVLLRPTGTSIVDSPESRLPDTERAEVVQLREVECIVPSADNCLEAEVRLLSGPDRGDVERFIVGDTVNEVRVGIGDKIRVVRSQVPEGSQIGGIDVPKYSLNDFERGKPLLWLTALFMTIVLIAGRWHGLRALLGLSISMAVVVGFIVPAILDGRSPLLVAIFGSFAVMLATIPLAHGFGAKTLAATIGTACSLLLTIALTLAFTKLAHITGFSAGDEVAYLKAYAEDISVQGLLLAGIVISALGVLDDVTVSQASTVMALRRADPTQGFHALFSGALAVGKDHITATVNTLVLAYVGASLPILLIFGIGDVDVRYALNSEGIASQIVATLTGSIGLIAAVPITTALAVFLATRLSSGEVEREGHAHAHSH